MIYKRQRVASFKPRCVFFTSSLMDEYSCIIPRLISKLSHVFTRRINSSKCRSYSFFFSFFFVLLSIETFSFLFHFAPAPHARAALFFCLRLFKPLLSLSAYFFPACVLYSVQSITFLAGRYDALPQNLTNGSQN